jgi:import inner membrane translocase subunit TIM22
MSTTGGPQNGKTREIYGSEESSIPLPFFRKLNIPKNDKGIGVENNPLGNNENCGGKIITGAVMGGVLGVGMGVFMGAMSDPSPIQVINKREVPQKLLREQMRAAYKATGTKSYSWAKSFAVLTALFGGIECVIEKYRGKHDVWNPVISGCAVGATLSAKQGPLAACAGCMGFAGFSFLVDKIME